MTRKRLILVILTILSLFPVFLNLLSSLNQPQIQANLEIYQANLVLEASEFNFEQFISQEIGNTESARDLRGSLLGRDPYLISQNQYLEAGKATQKNLNNFQAEFDRINSEIVIGENKYARQKEIEKDVAREGDFVKKINLNLGIIQAQRGEIEEAIDTWEPLLQPARSAESRGAIAGTAKILTGLWQQPPQAFSQAESELERNLKGWFRYRALERLYQVENRQLDLIKLQEEEQEQAKQAFFKLIFLSAIPFLGSILGIGILIFLLIQLVLKKGKAIIAPNSAPPWATPWTGETIWQVLIVGFFFWGQILLPILILGFGRIFNLNFADLSLRDKAIYILFNYFALAIGGLSILYFSLKPFFPLDKDWFRFRWLSNWTIWGAGGYAVALPLVLIVSLVNQQLWDGQGGSNPLLFLALEAQDRFVLAVFFFTASIAAPVYEEIMFRGFLLPSLTRYFSVSKAISISSLVFAVAHLNLSEVLPLVVLGIILGFTYTRSRNLLASILLHSLWNSGTLLSLFILGGR